MRFTDEYVHCENKIINFEGGMRMSRYWQPWEIYRKDVELIDIDSPPCSKCRHFRPHRLYTREGIFNGVQLCNASEMHRDFSCFYECRIVSYGHSYEDGRKYDRKEIEELMEKVQELEDERKLHCRYIEKLDPSHGAWERYWQWREIQIPTDMKEVGE